MNWLDIVVLVLAAISAFVGWFVGLVRVIVGLVGIGAGIAIASRFHAGFADAITSHFISSPGGAKVAAFLIIVVLVILAVIFIGFLVKKLLSLMMLGWLDKTLGLALGVMMCLAACSALLSVLYNNSLLGMRETIDGSFMGSFLVDQYNSLLEALKLVPKDFGREFH